MKSGFIANILFVVVINLLVKPLYIFGIDRVVQNEVGPAEYGLYFALFNFVYLFQLINDFGIQNFNHTLFSRHDQLIGKYLPRSLGTKAVLAPMFLSITLLSAWSLGYDMVATKLLVIILLNQVLASLVMIFRTTLSARGFYRNDSLLSIIDKLCMVIILGYLLYLSPVQITITKFVVAQTISLSIALAIASRWIWVQTGTFFWKIKFDWSFIAWQLKKSYPYASVLLLMTLYTRMDGVMIERLLDNGQVEAGIYAASYRILDAANLLGLLFAGLLLPMFGKALHDVIRIKRLIRMSTGLLLCISITFAMICYYFSHPLMQLLYEGTTEYWSQVFEILMISYVAVCMIYIYSTYLTAGQRLRMMNRVFLAGVGLNFVLNIVLISLFQAWGAALATVITQTVTAVTLVAIVLQLLAWKPNLQYLLRIAIFVLTMTAMAILLLQTSWAWYYQLAGMILLSLPLALITKLVRFEVLVAEYQEDGQH